MQEISAGIIIYRRTNEGIKFLLVYHGGEYWNFPKGKIESEEKSWQTAVREIREEVGLKLKDLKFKKNFKVHERFVFKRKGQEVFKIVIFYLAETRQSQIRLSYEHNGYCWITYKEAMKILSKYKDSQKVLSQANDFLSRKTIKSSNQNSPK
ncbi:MAG TPA: NUDIX domain-containing protein [Candidatus Wolfebacteria bacterium]|nr:NUDIX domain-containing protein [Candidatus Wolfebacteria bacterium]